MQDALTVMVDMFKNVGLETNLEKIKSLVCTRVYIWGKLRKEAHKIQATGEGETFRKINWLRLS